MNTQQLIQLLHSDSDKPLYFSVNGHTIPENYHVSEVKHMSIVSTDCGSNPHTWNETVLHLFIPANTEQHPPTMTTHKLHKILTGLNYLEQASAVKVEYSHNKQNPISVYQPIAHVDDANEMRVELAATISECKPINAQASEPQTCCRS